MPAFPGRCRGRRPPITARNRRWKRVATHGLTHTLLLVLLALAACSEGTPPCDVATPRPTITLLASTADALDADRPYGEDLLQLSADPGCGVGPLEVSYRVYSAPGYVRPAWSAWEAVPVQLGVPGPAGWGVIVEVRARDAGTSAVNAPADNATYRVEPRVPVIMPPPEVTP